ncbi:uncharacterized protein A1O5_07598 [Cladophialophora psammophila CBS 110553]|uniref:Xylanolytic transcriptional activator regulatory domain-containing protein n=1 Tax=Cladophialophora psammophila CBS 110553 TaxID=1182543 RepID=W9WN04_9EURO|nr:uncharacterized protein A1O5_07598 [Cladophialophora psammophila CBS 110553]EXJ69562.1 hypothetical protein A1O5_07598 [Cladophialophora psammophila CBS 110553]
MPDLSQYQTVFRIAKPNSSKRSSQAGKRKHQANGFQGNSSGISAPDHNGSLSNEDNISRAQSRLQKLEEMVTMLMQANQGLAVQDSRATPPSSDDSLRSGPTSANPVTALGPSTADSSSLALDPPPNGHLDIRGTETKYLGATHWAAILENIKDIQGCLAPEPDGTENGDFLNYRDDPDILLSNSQLLTLAEVCNSLPPRPVVDKLLSVQFNARYLHISFIHKRKFLREYESFWKNPASVSFLWISMLFSSLHLGARISRPEEQDYFPSLKEASDLFLMNAGRALVAGHYQKARPYSVEAVMLYAISRFFQQHESETEPWLLMGVAARLALRMGYHRDPSHFSHISPFEGEMRRRTFSTVQTFELLLSFQAGLPAIIHEEVCDTAPPSNLFDEDFDEASTAIPPSRPLTDPTPMLYYCYKGHLAQVFRKVARQALSPRVPAYADVLSLDGELLKVRAEIPPSLEWKSLSSSVTDEIHIIMHRLSLELVYQKAMMILHRRYLSHDRLNPAFEYSRNACTTASLQVLQYQAEVYQAAQPGGQLHHDQWTSSNLANHDFLLAAMITCLDLYESHRHSSTKLLSALDLDAQRMKYDALKISHDIWQSRNSISSDARRASNILATMLSKVPRPGFQKKEESNGTHIASTDISQPLSEVSLDGGSTANVSRDGSVGEPLPLNESAIPISNNGHSTTQDQASQELLDAIFADSDVVDWSILDQYIQEGATPMRSFDF